MNEATGPTYNHTTEELNIGDANHVQEALVLIGTTTAYALLGYVPASAMSVQIFSNRLLLLQGVDYTIDGRKIAFTAPMAGTESIAAVYLTTNEVATIPAVTIAFDIPGQNVRIDDNGSLQINVSGVWYDMYPTANPVTGDISFQPSQTPSPNQ